MWFFHHHWHQGTFEVLLALSLCLSSSHLSLKIASSGLCQLCHGSSTGRFLFQSGASHHFVFVYVWCHVLVYAFCFQVPCCMLYSPMWPQPLGFAPLQPFGAYPWQAYAQPGDGHQPTWCMNRVVAPSTALSGGSLPLLNRLSSSHSNYMVEHTAFGAWQRVTHITPPSLTWWGGVFSSKFGSIQWHRQLWICGWALNQVILVMMIRYQVDEFTHTWSAEWFVAPSHIYPGFTDKVSSLTHFPLEPGYEDYSFLDKAGCWLWRGLGFHPHWFHRDTRIGHILGWAWCHVTFSVSSGFLHLDKYYYWYYLNCSLPLALVMS